MTAARTVVVDASVTIKWVLKEAGREAALKILDSYREERTTLIAPRLILAETGNALWKLTRRKHLSLEQAITAYDFLLEHSPMLADSREIHATALQIALAHGRTMYDSLYVALALHYQCELITADAALVRATYRVFPFVRLLGG